MLKYSLLSILAFIVLGCQAYPDYSSRDYSAVKNGTNPAKIPSTKEYNNYSIEPSKPENSYGKGF